MTRGENPHPRKRDTHSYQSLSEIFGSILAEKNFGVQNSFFFFIYFFFLYKYIIYKHISYFFSLCYFLFFFVKKLRKILGVKMVIDFVEKNHSCIVIHGIIGYRKYIGYTKKECIEMYKKEAERQLWLTKR